MALENEKLQRLSLEAKAEIGEDEKAKEKLEDLKILLEEKYADLRLPPDFDDFLFRSLRVRKFDVPRAAKLISQYFKLHREISDMHACLLPSRNPELYRNLAVSLLKHRDSEGRAVILARQELAPPSIYSFDESLAGTILILDEVVRSSIDTQRIGVTLLVDFKGYGLAHFQKISVSRLRSAAKLFQDAFPARFKAFHFVRNPFLVSCMFAIVKPFLREKIKNRVYFHGYDLDSLQNHFSPEILPQFLGGQLPDNDYADMALTAKLLQRDFYYKEIFAHGYM